MSGKIKETLSFRTDLVLKSKYDEHLHEHEYLYTRIQYHESGKILKEIHYTPDGEAEQIYHYEYAPQGQLILEKLTEADDQVIDHKTWELDAHGQIIKEFRHYLDETFDTIEYQYNSQGQLTHKIHKDFDHEIESTEEFVYEGKHCVCHTIKDSEGMITSEITQKFDPSDLLLEETQYDSLEDHFVKKTISYNQDGLKEEVLSYNNNNVLIGRVQLNYDDQKQLIQIVEEDTRKKNTINMQYDTHGNIIFQEEFDKLGNLINTVKRTYNAQNQPEKSEVFVETGSARARNYSIRYEYTYF